MIKNDRNLLTLPCLICRVLRSNLPTRSNTQNSLKPYQCSAYKLDILPVSSAQTPPSGRSLSLYPFYLAAEMKTNKKNRPKSIIVSHFSFPNLMQFKAKASEKILEHVRKLFQKYKKTKLQKFFPFRTFFANILSSSNLRTFETTKLDHEKF